MVKFNLIKDFIFKENCKDYTKTIKVKKKTAVIDCINRIASRRVRGV